jgi:hypothetical protein
MSSYDCTEISEMIKELKPIVTKVPMNQTKFKEFLDKYQLDISESVLNNVGICSSVAVNIADNVASIPRECVTRIEKECRLEEERGVNYHECYRKYRPSMRNVEQDNTASVEQNCNINSLLEDDSVQKNNRLALVLKLLLADYKISCDEGVENSFSFINKDIKSVDVLNTCLNQSFLYQGNNLNLCYPDNILQKNLSNIIQNCAIESEVQSRTPLSQGSGGSGSGGSGSSGGGSSGSGGGSGGSGDGGGSGGGGSGGSGGGGSGGSDGGDSKQKSKYKATDSDKSNNGNLIIVIMIAITIIFLLCASSCLLYMNS